MEQEITITATERECLAAFNLAVLSHPEEPQTDEERVTLLGNALLDVLSEAGKGNWDSRPVSLVQEAGEVVNTAADFCMLMQTIGVPIAHDAVFDRRGIADHGTPEGAEAALAKLDEAKVAGLLEDDNDKGGPTYH